MATIAEPRSIDGTAARASDSSARAFALSVQSQCLSSVSSAGLMTPVAALCTSTSRRPSAATSSATWWTRRCRARGGSLPRSRSSSAGLGGAIVSQVADGDARRALVGEAKRDLAPDPA